MVALETWFKEQWIKKTSKPDFIKWGLVNTKYSSEELEWVYDSHVVVAAPVKEEKPLPVIGDEIYEPEEQTQTIHHDAGADEAITPEQAGAHN